MHVNILGAVQGANDKKIMADPLPWPCLPMEKNLGTYRKYSN